MQRQAIDASAARRAPHALAALCGARAGPGVATVLTPTSSLLHSIVLMLVFLPCGRGARVCAGQLPRRARGASRMLSVAGRATPALRRIPHQLRTTLDDVHAEQPAEQPYGQIRSPIALREELQRRNEQDAAP
jgi:hypothetical protein